MVYVHILVNLVGHELYLLDVHNTVNLIHMAICVACVNYYCPPEQSVIMIGLPEQLREKLNSKDCCQNIHIVTTLVLALCTICYKSTQKCNFS